MRKNSRWLTLLVGILLSPLTAALAEGGESGSPGRRGAAIYTAYCAACHGDNGTGQGWMAGALEMGGSPPATDLSTWVFQDSRNDKKLRAAILGGGSALHKTSYMPAWSQTLTDSQVDDVAAYVRSLKKDTPPNLVEVDPLEDELKIGRALYSIRCLPCHGMSGQGDGFLLDSLVDSGDSGNQTVGMPNFRLYSSIRSRSDDNFAAIISSGISHAGLALKTSNGWWNRTLSLAELRALILYLRSLPVEEGSPTP